MGIGAKQWRELAVGAREILGDGWVVAGRGGSTRVVRAPVGWSLQYVGYEDTRLGLLTAYNVFLVRPPFAGLTGEGQGALSDQFVFPGENLPRQFRDLASPEGVAEWASIVARENLDQVKSLHEQLAALEEIEARDDPRRPVEGPFLQGLVALRVVCGTRTREQLLADIDGLLAAPDLEGYRPLASTRKEPRTYREFFTKLREAVAHGDRHDVMEVVEDARRDSLRLLGVPEQAIGAVEFPTPEVKW